MLLYLHIPFCASKCGYCTFNSYPISQDDALIVHYFDALKNEIEAKKEHLSKNTIKTLYIGGGTPSLAHANHYEKVFEILHPYISETTELSIEANPESLTKEWAAKMQAMGINRLSIGVQSFQSDKLKLLQREHSEYDIQKCVAVAKEAGMRNISIDLIYGTIFDTVAFLESEIEKALALDVEHISAYCLSIEEGGGLDVSVSDDDVESAKYLAARLRESGFEWYEVSNFGKKKSLHNLGYWMGEEYLGIGAGAVGYVDNTRYTNTKNPKKYIEGNEEV